MSAFIGWICLDIDGTITEEIDRIPTEVLDYLAVRCQEGWKIVFVTGRIYSLAMSILEGLNFPYYVIPQNGASWFEMPKSKMIGKKYLSIETFFELEPLLESTGLDFVLITGVEDGDHCYYRPNHLSQETLDYFQNDLSKYGGHWKPVDSFKSLPIDTLPYGKIYGPRDELNEIYPIFKKIPAIKTHLVVDSARPTHSIIQIMRADVDKGKAVLELISKSTLPKRIIAAGNDLNDHTLLEIADVRIAIENSPKELLEIADIIAPKPKQLGIIQALDIAIERAKDL